MGKRKSRSGSNVGARSKVSSFMVPLTPSPALAAIVGSSPLPRTEVTKRVWDYIRKHKLQDPADKRRIKADLKLKVVFGGRAHVSMFEMSKLVSGHLRTLEARTSVNVSAALSGAPTSFSDSLDGDPITPYDPKSDTKND